MIIMKKIALILSLACLPLACVKESQNPDSLQAKKQVNLQQVTLVAGQEVATKTFFDKTNGVLTWTGSESAMGVYDGSALQTFSHVETTEGGAQASFSGTADVNVATWTAVHPKSHASVADSKVYVTFPCIQEARAAGGMKADINTMAAQVTHDGSGNLDHFSMKNVGGLLKLTVAKTGIKTITVSSRNGEALTGKAELSFDGSGNPVVTPVDYNYETFVTLKAVNMAEGLAVGEYFVNVFPVTMTTGLIIDMENIDGTVASVKSSTAATVARSADLEFAGFDTGANWYTPSTSTITLNFNASTWPFVEATTGSGTSTESKAWGGNTEKTLTYSADPDIKFYINCHDYCSAKSTTNGLRFGKGKGDYILFPALQGKNLSKVEVKYFAGKTDKTRPGILTRGGNSVVLGGDAVTTNITGETTHEWDLVGTAHNMQYRYQLTFDAANDVSYIDQIVLTYASKPSNLVLDVHFWTDNGTANGAVNQPFVDYTIPGNKSSQNQACTFRDNGVDYPFEIGGSYRILASASNRGLGLNNNGDQLGYIKVPGISGYKLASMSAVVGGPATNGNVNKLSLDFSTTATENSSARFSADACTMSEPSSFSKTFDSTEEGVAYYFVAKWGWLTLRNIRLVYTPVTAPAPAPASLLDGGETEL